MEQKEASTESGLALAQVFLESAHFSHRSDALGLPVETKPEIGQVEIEVTRGQSTDGRQGLIRITAKTNPSVNPLYNVEVTITGFIVQQAESPLVPLQEFLGSLAATNLVFPFVREVFGNLTSRGRFGPVWLSPVALGGLFVGERASSKDSAASPKS
jgi:preprotein translocase subunit SecB